MEGYYGDAWGGFGSASGDVVTLVTTLNSPDAACVCLLSLPSGDARRHQVGGEVFRCAIAKAIDASTGCSLVVPPAYKLACKSWGLARSKALPGLPAPGAHPPGHAGSGSMRRLRSGRFWASFGRREGSRCPGPGGRLSRKPGCRVRESFDATTFRAIPSKSRKKECLSRDYFSFVTGRMLSA